MPTIEETKAVLDRAKQKYFGAHHDKYAADAAAVRAYGDMVIAEAELLTLQVAESRLPATLDNVPVTLPRWVVDAMCRFTINFGHSVPTHTYELKDAVIERAKEALNAAETAWRASHKEGDGQ